MELMKTDMETTIRKSGCVVTGVLSNPPFAYSIGLTDKGWPEFIVGGVRGDVGQFIINGAVRYYGEDVEGRVPEAGDEIPAEVLSNRRFKVERVTDEQAAEYGCQAIYRQERIGGPKPTFVQLVYDDDNGKFPGEPGCDPKFEFVQALPVPMVDLDSQEGKQ